MKLTTKYIKKDGNAISLFFTGEDNNNYNGLTVLNLGYPEKLKFLNCTDCEWNSDKGHETISFFRKFLGKRILIRKITLLRNLMKVDAIPKSNKLVDFSVGKINHKFDNLTDLTENDHV